MIRFWGLRTTKAMLAAGMLAATLVTGCAGGAGQQQADTEAGQQESTGGSTATDATDALNTSNAATGESAMLLSDFDDEVIAGTGERTTLTEIAGGSGRVWGWGRVCLRGRRNRRA